MVSKRDHLVETAMKVFQRDGFHAAGIDRILAEAGVAKMTLYNHFRSKDDLILAALRRRDEQFRHWLIRTIEAKADAPRDRLLAVFDAHAEWHASDTFYGCLFLNAAAEFHDADSPTHAAAAEHKRLLVGYFVELARAAGAHDPGQLAEQIALLADGATAQAAICRNDKPAIAARRAAVRLLDSHLPALAGDTTTA